MVGADLKAGLTAMRFAFTSAHGHSRSADRRRVCRVCMVPERTRNYAAAYSRLVQSSPGRPWQVGAIANGQILVWGGGWVQLNLQASHAGPWRPGDVVNQHAFTGTGWVALPPGWWPDPTGRHQFRWWTGTVWSQSVMTSERQLIDPLPQVMRPYPTAPPAPPRRRRPGFWKALRLFWKVLYLFRSGTGVYGENILIVAVTGKTKGELARIFLRAAKRFVMRWRYYMFSGVVAAGGVALGVYFDDPDLLLVTLGVTIFTLTLAWVSS